MIQELHQKLVAKEISVEELTRDYLARLKRENPELNAFLTVAENEALNQAVQIDKKYLDKSQMPLLAGLPFAVKDNILIKDIKTTAGSKILENYIAPYNATVIKRLFQQSAIIIGKTNLDEFAMGSSTENSAFGPSKNPYDLERVPGGSSGGSAVAVAKNLAVYALGSDTGGSIRQPASFCGLVGFKPSYGAVSRYGLIAMASSLDQIGPLTQSVLDAKIVFEVIAGKDEKDATSYDVKKNNINLPPLKNIKIGVPKEYFIKGIDLAVEGAVRNSLKKIEAQGAQILEISLPYTPYALPCYYIIMPAEVSANLARYDGIRYSPLNGLKNDLDLMNLYFETRGQGFGPESRRRIILGTYVLSAGYYDAYYLKAQKVRRLIKQDFEKAFQKVDFIITPTTPTPAFKFGEKTQDPVSMYLSDIFTVSANLAGLPAINLPCGQNKNGLPLGLQIMAQNGYDFNLLSFSELIEQILKT